ncbi:MAG: hypothetical protein R6U96_14655 [Promethearchaeia archaeon]
MSENLNLNETKEEESLCLSESDKKKFIEKVKERTPLQNALFFINIICIIMDSKDLKIRINSKAL